MEQVEHLLSVENGGYGMDALFYLGKYVKVRHQLHMMTDALHVNFSNHKNIYCCTIVQAFAKKPCLE